ncbi:hypothetical protein KFU66_07195 [Escherichia coli]|uniref:DUF1796 family putative cysteine peptidase n=1 Tax=Escherichia coli TaxID=562 RepID=UPI001A2A19A7|nr:DUF1796 family putative cysteine peptidase [Escherichia coli]MCH4782134.1 papain-like cysteine peptidase [Escherichia coli]UUQ34053.1 hypothetical protein KFU66_07195 [Escherichia coli]HAV2436444.1 hypothetical protein [Escherichia coli]HBB3619998.1 hypothetical protein [Escherichia coli]HBC8293614.1 hypothetical protein [Escherichia coli]
MSSKLLLPANEYDFIASIGKKCQPAGRLKRMGFRTSSGPFDWFASQKLPEVTKIIQKGCDHLFLPENIKINGRFKNCIDITDTATGFRSIHDILIDDYEKQGIEVCLFNMMKKIKARRKRFIEKINESERVLLVRLNAERDAVYKLRSVLDKKFPTTKIDLLIFKERKGEDLCNIDFDMPDTYVVSGDNEPTNDEWLGSDQAWKIMLSSVKIRTYYSS